MSVYGANFCNVSNVCIKYLDRIIGEDQLDLHLLQYIVKTPDIIGGQTPPKMHLICRDNVATSCIEFSKYNLQMLASSCPKGAQCICTNLMYPDGPMLCCRWRKYRCAMLCCLRAACIQCC